MLRTKLAHDPLPWVGELIGLIRGVPWRSSLTDRTVPGLIFVLNIKFQVKILQVLGRRHTWLVNTLICNWIYVMGDLDALQIARAHSTT